MLQNMRVSKIALWVTTLILQGACGSSPEAVDAAGHPNFLLITIDTLRSDHCSVYGYPQVTTPHLDRLAREGVRFETAYAPMPVTGPSHATLFTSLHPPSHGVAMNGHVLGAEQHTLAEILARQGYATAAVVSSFPLKRKFGYAQGFEHFDDDFPAESASIPAGRWEGQALRQAYDRRATATTDRALDWLRGQPASARPWFLWVHYFDPHTPYDAPPSHARRASAPSSRDGDAPDIEAYDAEIRFTDSEIGRLAGELRARDLDSTTLLMLTADHGEGLGQHGEREHGREVYEEAVRIPLVLRWPGRLARGRVLPGPATLADLAPTALALMGVPPGRTPLHGVNLAPTILDATPGDMQRDVFLQAEYRSHTLVPALGVRSGRWKYVETRLKGRTVRTELFDIVADPAETVDVGPQHRQIKRRLAARVRQWRRAHSAPRTAPVAEADQESLRSLGYVQ